MTAILFMLVWLKWTSFISVLKGVHEIDRNNLSGKRRRTAGTDAGVETAEECKADW